MKKSTLTIFEFINNYKNCVTTWKICIIILHWRKNYKICYNGCDIRQGRSCIETVESILHFLQQHLDSIFLLHHHHLFFMQHYIMILHKHISIHHLLQTKQILGHQQNKKLRRRVKKECQLISENLKEKRKEQKRL